MEFSIKRRIAPPPFMDIIAVAVVIWKCTDQMYSKLHPRWLYNIYSVNSMPPSLEKIIWIFSWAAYKGRVPENKLEILHDFVH